MRFRNEFYFSVSDSVFQDQFQNEGWYLYRRGLTIWLRRAYQTLLAQYLYSR